MKTRKVFLEGYIELSPVLFKSKRRDLAFVSITQNNNILQVNSGAMQEAKVRFNEQGVYMSRVFINKEAKSFAIVFDDSGEIMGKTYKANSLRISNSGMIRKLQELGFKSCVRYKATSPEEGVLVVTLTEV